MDPLTLILVFIFGTIVGSFLNVVALRFNTGMTLGGRSKCLSCGTTLTWLELIPILSFAAQRGACKKCNSKISWQYPLVEFAAGALFVLILFAFPPVTVFAAVHTGIYIVSTCLLLVITVYDMKHKIIPDRFVWVFNLLALANLFIGTQAWFAVPGWGALLAGPIIALPFALLWVISRGRAMGLGDAKLVLGLGWLAGLSGGVNAVILAFWIGAVVSVAWMLVTYRKFRAKTEIPFGPYLILGFYLAFIFHIEVLDVGLLRDILMSYL